MNGIDPQAFSELIARSVVTAVHELRKTETAAFDKPSSSSAALMAVADPNAGTARVAVTITSTHIMSEAKKFSFAHVNFSRPSEVLTHVKNLRTWFDDQTKVLPEDDLKILVRPFFKSTVRGTHLHYLFKDLWSDAKEDWEKFLDKVVDLAGSDDKSVPKEIAKDLMNYVPPATLNLKSTLLHFAGQIARLNRLDSKYLPHADLLADRVELFTPVNVRHLLDKDALRPGPEATDDPLEYIKALKKSAEAVHYSTNPIRRVEKPSTAPASQDNVSKKGKSASQSAPDSGNPPAKPNNSSNSNGGTSQQRGNHGRSTGGSSGHAPQTVHANATSQAKSFATARQGSSSYTQTANQHKTFVPNSPGPRPAPLKLNAPATVPRAPAVSINSGDVVMDGTGRMEGAATPQPKSGKQLGRLEADEGFYVLCRVDTGADAHILGKEFMGHVIPTGKSEQMFSVPLARRKLAAEMGKVEATLEGTDVTLSGVLSPMSSACLRPEALIFGPDVSEPHAIIEGVRTPVIERNGSPYVEVCLRPVPTRTLRDFTSSMGFSNVENTSELAELLHLKFGCASYQVLDVTCRILGFPLKDRDIRNACASCELCPTSGSFRSAENITSNLPAMIAEPSADVLAFDHGEAPIVSERGNKFFLVAKTERTGRFFIRPGHKGKATEELITIVTHLQIPIVACVSDNAAEFLRFGRWCRQNRIDYNPSFTQRPEFKGRQENAVLQAKRLVDHLVKIWDYEKAEMCWDLVAYAAEHILNTRASPTLGCIPFHVTYNVRPRYDLMPLTGVHVVLKGKLMTPERVESAIFLGQATPETCYVWKYTTAPAVVSRVHVSSIRASKFTPEAFFAQFKEAPQLGALSTSARPIRPSEKKTREWREAIVAHCVKLLDVNFARTSHESKAVRSFFVGRVVDGKISARLVSNGCLDIDGLTLNQYLPVISERFLVLTDIVNALAQGRKVFSGDISGAYYSTKGTGSITLPHDWPPGFGGFHPNQVVDLNCAIPGDSNSSGLFLAQLDDLLSRHGLTTVAGRYKVAKLPEMDVAMINFSDDILGHAKTEKDIAALSDVINKEFKITLECGVPPKWVGMDLNVRDDGVLEVTSASTLENYE